MSVIWSGITEEGAVVPVQVEESGKVVAQGYPGEKGDKGDPGEEGPEGPPGEYSKGDDVELNNASFTGKVGVGTDDPQAMLQVKAGAVGIPVPGAPGAMQVGDGGAFGLMFGCAGSGKGYCQAQRNDGNTSTYDLLLNPNGGDVGVGTDNPLSTLDVEGDVVLRSRNKKWMIVEQSGLAHLVEQSVFLRLNPHLDISPDGSAFGSDPDSATGVLEPVETVYPELRNIPGELTLVEQALSEVFEKLKMSPPAGWPVWDGQNEVTSGNDNA